MGIDWSNTVFGSLGVPGQLAFPLAGNVGNMVARVTSLAESGKKLMSEVVRTGAPDVLRELAMAQMPPVSRKDKNHPRRFFRLAMRRSVQRRAGLVASAFCKSTLLGTASWA
jgi:class 3 adenylate cyclase